MKSIDLYLKVLNVIRYDVLNSCHCRLSDFEEDSKAYDLLVTVNDACNKLSALIDIMKYETK